MAGSLAFGVHSRGQKGRTTPLPKVPAMSSISSLSATPGIRPADRDDAKDRDAAKVAAPQPPAAPESPTSPRLLDIRV